MIVIPFNPATNPAPFAFQVVLDGAVYTARITSNLSGQRYYLSVYTVGGTLVFSTALVGSPVGYDISLSDGYFRTKLVWRPAAQVFEVFTP